MAGYELLTLELRSSILYAGIESPPLAGIPFDGRVLMPDRSGAFAELGVGEGLAEGEEELFLLDPEDLVAFDLDEGPEIRRPLPSPRFYGRHGGGERESSASTGPSSMSLEAGAYIFLQWRPRDEGELAEGLEWFARESWWERAGVSGPYLLRRVREEGGLATQALRRIR
jgi:hypothetical protein